jgi:hypothetical protein
MYVSVFDIASDFAEDKDTAAKVRNEQIAPALLRGEDVLLDFVGVDLTTQSFIHAMISDVLRSHGEDILDHIEFRGCRPGVQGIIETVIQYSLETLDDDQQTDAPSG